MTQPKSFATASPPDQQFDALVAEVSRRLETGASIDLEAIAAAHPEHLDRLRGLLPTLQALAQITSLSADAGPNDSADSPRGTLGDFRIVREIGRGGMGVVYEAEQMSLHRRVALKMLPFAGVLDARQLQRFQNEAVAAASLKHPGIVQVYSVGCERGIHYYAMEYIEGRTLAEVVRQFRHDAPAQSAPQAAASGNDPTATLAPSPNPTTNAPSENRKPKTEDLLSEHRTPNTENSAPSPDTQPHPQARLSTEKTPRAPGHFQSVATWGVQAAEAIEHAHQMGVVHRDIKPSNLLIDAKGRLLVTDFGLAQTQFGPNLTMTGDILGTLRYMSPEQAQGNRQILDHRSDIYSLGVTLYELLALRPPFASDDRHVLIHEIVDGNPPPLRQHDRTIPRDLETIVLKAIASEPQHRYATAQQLADDLECYLQHKPIQARRPTLADRAAKWARRHRTATWSAAVALVVCVVTLAASAIFVFAAYQGEKEQARIAAANAIEAEQNAARADLNATRAEQNAARAQQYAARAANNLAAARRAVDDMYTQVAEKWLAQQAQMSPLQRQFLEKALAFYEPMAKEPGADPAVRLEAARAQERVGHIRAKLGQHAQADASLRRAVELFQQLADELPGRAPYKQGLANAHGKLGWHMQTRGLARDAEQEFRLALSLRKALVDQFPAESQFQRDLAHSHYLIGAVYYSTARPAEAEAAFGQSIALYQTLLARSPGDRDLKFRLAESQAKLAESIRPKVNRGPQIESLYQSVIARAAALAADDPREPEYRELHASSLHNLASLLSAHLERHADAEPHVRQALPIFERLVDDFPQIPGHRANLANAFDTVAEVLMHTKRNADELERARRRALEIREKLAADNPLVANYRSAAGGSLNNVALLLMARKQWQEARSLLDRAITNQKAALKINAKNGTYGMFLTNHLTNLTEVQLALGDKDAAARTAYEFACHILLEKAPEGVALLAAHRAEQQIGMTDVIQRPDWPTPRETALAARVLFAKALIRRAIEIAPNDPRQNRLADVLTTGPAAFRDPELALKLARRAVELDPKKAIQSSLGWALYRNGDWNGSVKALKQDTAGDDDDYVLAMAYWKLGNKDEALAHFHRACQWYKDYEEAYNEVVAQGGALFPPLSQINRLQAEAAALLGAMPSPAKPPAKEKEKPQKQ